MALSHSEFIKIVSACGQGYLSSGGPTSRLEEKLMQAGQTHGYPTEVYATPTGMFVSVKYQDQIMTGFERILGNETNFTDMLFYDNILEKFSSGSMSPDEAKQKLRQFKSRRYSFFLVTFCTLLIGFIASYLRFGELLGGVLSGLICAFIYVLNRPLIVKLRFSGVFTDFVGSLVAFFLSVIAGFTLNLPATVFVIGSLILIVPGLTLTSAISELADHNFVSGTVKLMKAILILVAMGVAYLLIENILQSMGYDTNLLVQTVSGTGAIAKQTVLKTFGRILLIASFCIYFNTPWRAMPGAVFCGLLSILVLDQFTDPRYFVMASFSASMTVGLVSLFFARIYGWPSQVFSTPGILSLVPGLLALSSFYTITESPTQGAIAYRVALSAGAIVFGLFSARMPFRIYKKIIKEPIQL
jgi:uncharacterized membrane protein YjjP (DUF1212 family)